MPQLSKPNTAHLEISVDDRKGAIVVKSRFVGPDGQSRDLGFAVTSPRAATEFGRALVLEMVSAVAHAMAHRNDKPRG